MSYPIGIKFRHIESQNTFQETNFSNVYLTDITNLLFTDNYKRGSLESEMFLFALIDKKEVWSRNEDLEHFLIEFKEYIIKSRQFDKRVVLNKKTSSKIDWFVTDIKPIIKSKSIFRFLKSNSEYRTLRLFDDLTFCIHDGTTNLFFTIDALNLDDIFEAVPIVGTTDYQKGDKIEIIKKSISGLIKFERDLKELDNLKKTYRQIGLNFLFITQMNKITTANKVLPKVAIITLI